MYRDPRKALALGFACLVGLVATGAVALLIPAAHPRDGAALHGFTVFNRGWITDVAVWIAHLCDPRPYALAGTVLVCAAMGRRRPRVAVAIIVILLGSAATTQLLKPLLATHRPQEWLSSQIASASWPSGHATAALALALCGVVAVPARWRRLAGAVGGALAVAVAYAILVLAWHFPSDVLGGYLVAGMWTAGAVCVLFALERRSPVDRSVEPRTVPSLGIAVGLSAAFAAFVAAVALAPADRRSFLVGAVAIAGLAVSLAGGLARALSRR